MHDAEIIFTFSRRDKGGVDIFLKHYVENSKTANIVTVYSRLQDLNVDIVIFKNGNEISTDESISLIEFIDKIPPNSFNKATVNHLSLYSIELFLHAIKLLKLKNPKIKLDIYLHDQFMLCPTAHLMNTSNRYCNLPSGESACRKCLSSKILSADLSLLKNAKQNITDIRLWRDSTKQLMSLANTVTAFSKDNIDKFTKIFPGIKIDISSKLSDVAGDLHGIQYNPYCFEKEVNIAMIGEANSHKGYNVFKAIQGCAMKMKLSAVYNFFLIGSNTRQMCSVIKNLGPYSVSSFAKNNLTNILEQNKITLCIIPSLCAESYCMTVDSCMKTNIPLAVFNIGAPPERVKNYKHGLIIDDCTAESMLHLSDIEIAKKALIAVHDFLKQKKVNK